MAARVGIEDRHALERGVWDLFLHVTGTAASPLTINRGLGIVSVTDAGAGSPTGLLTITLADKWHHLLNVTAQVLDAGTVDDWEFIITAETVATTKTIIGQLFKGGVATTTVAALPTTAKLMLTITVGNDSILPVKGG